MKGTKDTKALMFGSSGGSYDLPEGCREQEADLSLTTRVHICVDEPHPQACLTSVFFPKLRGGTGTNIKWETLSATPAMACQESFLLTFIHLSPLSQIRFVYPQCPLPGKRGRDQRDVCVVPDHEHTAAVFLAEYLHQLGPSAVHQGQRRWQLAPS